MGRLTLRTRLALTGTLATVTLAGLVAPLALTPAESKPKDPPPASSNANQDPGEGSCDVDGVDVRYTVGFDAITPPPSYRVQSVTVSGISPTCAEAGDQATLSVTLTDGTNPAPTASTPVTVGETSMTLTPSRLPRAEDVTAVHVELAGGRLPVPAECAAMSFDNVLIGTTGDDDLTTTQRRNIVFGLGGDDMLRGSQRDDCLVGQDGADHLFGDQGKDVLVGGPGDDHLDGGNGKDVCIGGDGDDTFANCETTDG